MMTARQAVKTDRRLNRRFTTDLPTELRLLSEVRKLRSLTARILDLSVSGAFIKTSLPLELRDKVVFEVNLSSYRGLMLGIVRWVKDSEPQGVGIQFLKHHVLGTDGLLDLGH